MGKEGLRDGRVLHNGHDPQPAPTTGTDEDIEGEHGAPEQRLTCERLW